VTEVLFFLETVLSLVFLVYTLSAGISIVLLFISQKPFIDRTPEGGQDWPVVTIQLPIFNESQVVDRLLRGVSELDYPMEKLEIQILDDSTDYTAQLIDQKIEELLKPGFNIKVLRRPKRIDFKTGFLRESFESVNSEFIAVFDADFLPPENWLKAVVPHLIIDPRLGFVQTRWGYFNDKTSAVTMTQAILLDIHFMIEKPIEQYSGLFLNYNGSAGIWRKKAIENAGGWPVNTLSEDLALSFRSQLDGWKALYLPQEVVLSELPSSLYIFGKQQERWAAGASQVLLRLGRKIFFSDLRLAKRLHALSILAGFGISILWITQLVLIILMMAISKNWEGFLVSPILFLFMTIISGLVSQKKLYKDWLQRCKSLPIFILITLGLSVRISKGFIIGLISGKIDFNRTPKNGATDSTTNDSLAKDISLPGIGWKFENSVEMILAACTCFGVVYTVQHALWLSFILMLFSFTSFVIVSIISMHEILSAMKPPI
jgi:cellulose synthase/poly-beta-1,6-N-acetylglucosamine synthase-like glycosyltransferase